MEQTIELDCAPGLPRPGDHIKNVMAGTAVEYDGREPISMLMGEWTWDFSDIPADKWKAAQPTFQKRITALYNAGYIRYGSW